jgi:fatty acid desaturase
MARQDEIFCTAMNPPQRNTPPVEWLTVGLGLLVYAVLGAIVWSHAILPWWVILPVGAYFACLHTSLQHEVLHGHPTRSRFLNELLIFLTPTMWLPYGRYRDTHLAHHNNAHLTDPEKDPESYYLLPETWAHMPGPRRILFQINHTLGGRMLIGPAVGIARFWSSEAQAITLGDKSRITPWLVFAASCACVMAYVVWCGMPVWQYVLLVAYPGISLALVRSYCEHQAAEDVNHRTIVVECSLFWSLLFLNNNLHVAHHERPALAWYKLPGYYTAAREVLIRQNNGYRMSYAEMFRRYFFAAKEPISYPNVNWLKR